jgi:AraC family transcriptional regulator
MSCQNRAELEPRLGNHSGLGARSSGLGRFLSVEAEEILDEVRFALSHDLDAANAGVARLAALIKSKAAEPIQPAPAKGGLTPWQKRKVLTYIEDRLGEPVPVERVAAMVALSVSHFSRAFKESLGQTPHAHIVKIRIKRAKDLMLTTNESLSQISVTCGFADQSHLSRTFRRVCGQSPNAWRRANTAGARQKPGRLMGAQGLDRGVCGSAPAPRSELSSG